MGNPSSPKTDSCYESSFLPSSNDSGTLPSDKEKFPLLLRCNVFDEQTGICLLDKNWQWPLQASPYDISKMVLSFKQISGQLGYKSKEVKQVIFGAKYNDNTRILSSRRRQLLSKKKQTAYPLRMILAADENVVISLFHRLIENNQDILEHIDAFLTELLQEFQNRDFTQIAISLRSQLNEIAKTQENIELAKNIMNNFSSFEYVIEILKIKHNLDFLL